MRSTSATVLFFAVVAVAILVPGATLSIYEASGHAPFVDEADRFARDLTALVEASRPAR